MESNSNKLPEKGHTELAVQFCPACEKYIFYPREFCPYCLEVRPEWRECTGRGIIYSYTIVRKSLLQEFEDRVPYTYAIVELHEGIRIPTNIIDCPVDQVRIGLPVELARVEESKNPIPLFRPATS